MFAALGERDVITWMCVCFGWMERGFWGNCSRIPIHSGLQDEHFFLPIVFASFGVFFCP